ncbi:hypothetical protein A2872_02350 [Candidatus Gottesmanbacteria bacterium RIFCSPHIGHO2_01_FULL_42_12]|uniref:Uncharacterized protein n=1 Tax=Candidatus Gottesmanbacteria bacterium RIFCSPHIGHO2_01_FULL_42_12 TaxID=1798377 RepID=A0A1F5Z4P8_9BACT|nr:MAG: hypothetical protein A2872_02350 [Candidatus Gottesmanbacteria bacterium RIFCSPHIGHO2_01_FULL_42_12]
MKKTNRQTESKMSASQSKRFGEAKISYEKMLQEVASFVPKTQAKEVSTAGKWQNTSTLSFY